MRATKAVVVEPVGGHGGMNYYDAGLCAGLAHAGVEVVLHTCDINTPRSDVPGFRVAPTFRGVYGADPAWRRGIRFVRALVRLVLSARQSGARVAHFHFFHVAALEFLGVLLAKLAGMKLVVTAHDVESFKDGLSDQRFVRWSYGLADAVIAHNQASAAEVVSKLGVAPERLFVVRHGNYVPFVSAPPPREEARRRVGLDGDGPALLFFGQIKEVKGLDVLLAAFGRVAPEFPSARLVIAGRVWKDDFGKYRQLIEELGIAAQVVEHIRYIRDDEVSTFYGAADAVVLPYRRIYQSGVLLMAMSYGVASVVSDLPAMLETIEDGVSGLAFKSGDSEALAAVLRRVLADPKGCSDIAAAGKQRVVRDFDWDQIGAEVGAVYRTVLESK